MNPTFNNNNYYYYYYYTTTTTTTNITIIIKTPLLLLLTATTKCNPSASNRNLGFPPWGFACELGVGVGRGCFGVRVRACVCVCLYCGTSGVPTASDKDEELDSLELVPNIILNPGFCDSDDQGQHPLSPPVPRTLPYGHRYGHPGYTSVGGPHAHRLAPGGLLPNGSSSYGGGMPGILTNTTGAAAAGGVTTASGHAGTGGTADDEDDDDEDEDEEPMTFSRRMSIFFTGNTIKRI